MRKCLAYLVAVGGILAQANGFTCNSAVRSNVELNPGSHAAPVTTGGPRQRAGEVCNACTVVEPLRADLMKLTIYQDGSIRSIEWVVRTVNYLNNSVNVPISFARPAASK